MVRKRTVGITTGAIVATIGLLAVPLSVMADQQILDDLIVDGSACVGQDCVNGESFGFDTIRIKENNLRIKAQDTSSTASFPTQDWQLTFNDSSNGGQNKFSIDAISPSSGTPFTIEASNGSHHLYVDDGGRIGFGTATPVADLHVKTGNTPTLRLEQDGSSGFSQQTWDVAGNEANFFIRDASNGSTLPFRLFPGAPSNALTIEGSTGDIGVGTNNPNSAIDIQRTGTSLARFQLETGTGEAQMRFETDGNARIVSRTAGGTIENQILFMPGGGVQILGPTATDVLAEIDQNGNLDLEGTITCNGGGACP